MKPRAIYALIALCSACAQAAPEHSTHLPPFILDQSQGVFFEDFSDSTFTQQLFRVKNKFGDKQVVLGGMAEFDLQHWRGDTLQIQDPEGTYSNDTAFYFTETTFDVMANLTPWMMVFTNSSLSAIGQGGESGNYFNLPYAFILLGNIEASPFYIYGGLNAISFGEFNGSGGWDEPLTETYFEPQDSPGLSIGYQRNHVSMSATLFTDQVLYETHFATSFLYQNNDNLLSYGLGFGYLTHLDLNTTGDVNINRNLPKSKSNMATGKVVDLNGNIGYNNLSFSAEYLSGSKAVLMNADKPIALGTTLTYTPTFNNVNYAAGLSYSKTLHLKDVSTIVAGQDQIPNVTVGLKNSWAASLTRNFIEPWLFVSINAQRDLTYENQKTYTLTLDAIAYL